MPTADTSTPAWHAAYFAAREGAALFDLPGTTLIEVTGSERAAYVNGLVTNKVDALPPGAGARAFLLTPTKGRVVADLLVCATAEALWLEAAAGGAPAALAVLRRAYFGQDVEIHDRTGAWRVLSLQGPEAAAIVEAAGGTVPPDAPGAHVETTIGTTAGRVVRWTDTGAPGFHLWIPAADADAAGVALAEAGATPGHDTAWTVLQIEAGLAAFGRELTEEVIPLEAPTENAISHVKGCYPGQEVIARLHMRGRPARHLRGLVFTGGEPPSPGAVLDADGKPGAATVTASGTSPRLGPIALAYVHRDWCAAGTRLRPAGGADASTGGASQEAIVAELPLLALLAPVA